MGLRGVARTSQALGLPMVLEAVDSGGVEGRRAPSMSTKSVSTMMFGLPFTDAITERGVLLPARATA